MKSKAAKRGKKGEWVNWSGSVRFRPARAVAPRDEEELVDAIRTAAEEGRRVRPVGALHSSSPIIAAEDVLVSLERLKGVISTDPNAWEAKLRPGTLSGPGRWLGP